MINAIIVDKRDTVAMVTAPVEAEQDILVTGTGQVIKAKEPIKAGHKVALVRLEAGEAPLKYGIPIGRMLSAIDPGGWISTHNLEDTTEELCGEYCRRFRESGHLAQAPPPIESSVRMIKAYPRENGSFGIRNYIMVIPTTPDTNGIAEAISDQTGCAWFVCDRTRLDDGKVSEYTRKAMIFTGRNPNLYAALILDAPIAAADGKGIYEAIAETGKPLHYLAVAEGEAEKAISEGVAIIEGFQKAASALQREPVSMEGFGLTVHCSGSDWTTAINGNSAVGAAADRIVRHGGRIFMTEWMEWSGSQHLMAEQCATYELGLDLLDAVDRVRATVLRETGKPVEYMNPVQANKDAGLTTLVEKSTGTIRKMGSTPIQGLLHYCEQPAGKGIWLPMHDSVWPPTSAIYGSLSGAHMSVLNTGIGFLYFELPHMLCIRTTGNTETFNNPAFKLDFNAGIAAEGKTVEETGELLFEYLIRIAEGDEEPKAEIDKVRAFNMYYYTENEFGAETDRSRILPASVTNYREQCRRYTDSIK
ncbi:MAG: altronate dehydratase family protein [Clostridiales bacterium]|nr:altronate dehydratase family protein [Clostridiales bacterium]